MPWTSSSQPETALAATASDDTASDAFTAAALLLVDPLGLGGVRLQADAGPVRDAWLRFFHEARPAGTPVMRLPAHAGEDRLLGGLDLAATLATGRPVAQPGVLTAADGGVVVAAMAERLPPTSAAHLRAALDQQEVTMERDGLTQRWPSRIALVALDEAQADDRPLDPGLADRLGLWLNLRPLSMHDALAADAALAADVARARTTLARVSVPQQVVQALCAAALALGADSSRSAWQALRCARANAALRGECEVDAEDAALAARLVLAPRATRAPQMATVDEPAQPAPAPSPAPPPDSTPAEAEQQAAQDGARQPPPPEHDPSTLEDRLVAAAVAALPPGLLARLAAGERVRSRAAAAGRAGAAAVSLQRGRPLGSRRGRPGGGARLHLLDTLRAAAPWQRLRREEAQASGARPSAAVLVRAEDFRLRKREHRRSTTTIFALDASGSSALHRLAEAKGAIEGLLAECYVRRDEVAVLAFRGAGAQLLLPPTRSLVRARRGLQGLPGGGGTPLAAGIDAAAALAACVRRDGATPVVVLLTDGRANVARDGQGGRARAQEEALAAARALALQGGSVLVIDTSVRPEAAARALAVAARARYLALPQADAQALSKAVRAATRSV